MQVLLTLLLIAAGIAAFVLLLIFVMVPLFKGLGWMIGGIFKGIGWLIAHIFEFIIGMISDTLRFVGAIIATIVLVPMALLSVLIGRWSAAGHFADSVKREWKVAGLCLYRVALRRPLKLVLLHVLLEGVEQRVPEAMAAAPTSDKPSKRTGQFAGYTIVGSLKSGGSGAKLYIAEPDASIRAKYPGMPDRVVIKSFALSEGSSLPQIVRESRALECAKQLGLVFDHGMTEQRFFYVMPYHAGDHLGIVTRQLHGETEGRGLERKQLAQGLGYICDLVETLSAYHRGGLWHKDVKPENIIIRDGRAHLVDLGLITPLRSAMTLTTHGTEYFRDPEMVRQALRGVKVHQVNGEKFDVFAAGAVLYFMIENDFPPHGALSRVTRKAPDAVKWIVRRAMADYNHRYESADMMLADLRFVAAAPDPFAIKPAQLPSMSGEDVEAAAFEEPEIESVARAASPVPPAGNATQFNAPESQAAATGYNAGAPAPARPINPGRRPKLRVTNWWTGAYQVEDPGAAGDPNVSVETPSQQQARLIREQASALRHEAADIKCRVRRGAITARRAAREQIKTARSRAREVRKRARQHRHRAVAERQPSKTLMAIGCGTILLIGASFAALVLGRSGHMPNVYVGSPPVKVELPGPLWGASASATNVDGAERPVMLVRNVSNPTDPDIAKRIEDIVEDYRKDNYNVILADQRVEDNLRALMDEWDGVGTPSDKALEEAMAIYNLYGVIHVTDGEKEGTVDRTLVYSTHDDAKDRQYLPPPALTPAEPYLLLNDHPTKHDSNVQTRVASMIARYYALGWEVISDDEIEAAVRKTLPVGHLDPQDELSDVFYAALDENDLAGVIYIFAGEGEGPANKRVSLLQIDARDAED